LLNKHDDFKIKQTKLVNDFLGDLCRTRVRLPNTPLMKQYLKWLEALNESRQLRIRLIKDKMRKENIHSERLQNHASKICQHGGRGNTRQF
jgi:hypothetical protein